MSMPEQASGPVRHPRPRRPRSPQAADPAANGTAPHAEAVDEPRAAPAPDEPVRLSPPLSLAERRLVAAVDELRSAEWAFHSGDAGDRELLRQVRSGVVVGPYGLGYLATAMGGVSMTLSRLRESRGDLTAELAVRRWNQHLYQARMSLTSGTHRVSTAKLLGSHPASDADIDWREILEQLCLRVLAQERAGEPVEHVGQADPQPAPPRVIEPYLPEAATLVWAPQGVGKSTFAAAVVVSLEQYVEVIPGWHPKLERRCLVLDWESSPSEWNDRLRAIAAGVDVDPPRVAYRRMRQPLADAVESIAEQRDRDQIGYLVVDSFEKAAGARADSGTYEEKAERLFLALDRIALPSLIIDHVAGEDFRGGPSKVHTKSIGSVLKGAWARATYDLKRDPDASTEGRTEMVLHNVKVNDAARQRPYEFALVYDSDRGHIRFERSSLTSPDLLASLPLGDRMLRHLVAGEQHSLPTKELAKQLDVSESSVRSVVKRDTRFTRLPDNSIAVVHQA